MNIPIPQQTARVFESAPRNLSKHPGLLLDKFVDSFRPEAVNKWQEGVQKPTIELAIKQTIDEKFWATVSARHDAMTASATRFDARTTGPLTMHLSRAGALENAGLCLHPIYGFAYLPGTGLKGLARAYAETIAKPAGEASLADILTVFGKSPTRTDKSENAGSIIFFDAWPTAVPKLEIDIVNNHHSDYYTNKEGRNPPPGDWEAPVPVYFIAVAKNTTFRFAIRKRRDDVPDRLLDLARQWLIGGLTHLGAGAKTNAGYGSFVEVISGPDKPKPLLPENAPRATFNCTLELVTPAFLAGAKQDASDCDLRPATLRGQLRWWWRTLHAGYLPVEQLRTLEAAIWGDTNRGGAVRVEVAATSTPEVIASPFKIQGQSSKGKPQVNFDPNFARKHQLVAAAPKQTQGLSYLAYGMDEISAGARRQRHCVLPGARWQVTLHARSASGLNAHASLAQAKAALKLLCMFGGVGSKCRKGFGSLADPPELAPLQISDCINDAHTLRINSQFQTNLPPNPPETPALDAMLALSRSYTSKDYVEVATPWVDPWFALDQLGAIYIEFTQSNPGTGHGKHCDQKAALGLPRQIHGPRPQPLGHQKNDTWQAPVQLRNPHNTDRFASPVHLHLTKTAAGKLAVRAIASPTRLPDTNTSKDVLGKFIKHIESSVRERGRDFAGPSQPVATPAAGPSKRPEGTPVRIKLSSVSSAVVLSNCCELSAGPVLPSPFSPWQAAQLSAYKLRPAVSAANRSATSTA